MRKKVEMTKFDEDALSAIKHIQDNWKYLKKLAKLVEFNIVGKCGGKYHFLPVSQLHADDISEAVIKSNFKPEFVLVKYDTTPEIVHEYKDDDFIWFNSKGKTF